MDNFLRLSAVSALALGLMTFTPAMVVAQETNDNPLADILGPEALGESEPEKPDLTPAASADASIEAEAAADADAEEEAAPAPRRRSGPIAALDEIKVTAQKTEENVQDVPLSVTAVGREAIEFKGLNDINSVALFTPNVNLLSTPTFTFVYMRGVGSGFNKGFEQSVATIIDGVFYSRPNYLNDTLLDLDAVETLRGPQGTLQGKNSTAGALNFRTGNPEPEFATSLDVQYAFPRNSLDVKGHVTGPIVEDKLSFRLAASYTDQDGDVYNTFLDRMENDNKKWAVRGKLLWNINEDMDVQIGVTYSDLEQNGTGAQLRVLTPDVLALYRLFDPEVEADVFNFQNSSNTPGFVKRDTISADINFNWTVFDDAQIAYVGGYSTFDDDVLFDADFGPAPILDQDTFEEYEQMSHELRFHSGPGDFEYVAGLYYFQSTIDLDSSNHLLDAGNIVNLGVPVLLNNVLGLGPVVDGLFGGLLGQQGLIGGVLNLLTPATNLLSLQGEDLTYQYFQKSTSYAAFGQATWYVDDRWTLIAGARVTYEKKEADKSQQISGTEALWALLATPDIMEFDIDRELTEFDFTPKFSVKYQIAEDIMTFFTYGQGFKAGGFNPQSANANEFEYDPESSRTYELGLRTKFFNGLWTVNLTGYWTNFKDIQVVNFVGTRFVVVNASKARVRGVEFEATAPITENIILTGTFGWADAHYTDFKDGPCTAPAAKQGQSCDLSGKEIGDAIPLNGNVSVITDWPVWNGKFNIFAAVDALYQGEQFNVIDLDPLDKREAYWAFALHTGVRDPDDMWVMTFHMFNIFDRDILAGSADLPLFPDSHFGGQGPARYYSVQARVKF